MRENIGKYMYAEEQPKNEKRKTKIWEICSKSSNITLGEIYWHSHWRQYVFKPQEETIYSLSCLQDINAFIGKQKLLHKLSLIEERENKNG